MKQDEPLELISYPCVWLYKVIGADADLIAAAVEAVVGGYETLSPSGTSSSGRYISYNLEVMVSSREHRDRIYSEFKAHPDIAFIL